MRPESLGSLYSCQAAFLSTRTRCGQPAISILRAYCADHDAQALTAARWTLGWTHAVLDLVDKPCTACLPARPALRWPGVRQPFLSVPSLGSATARRARALC
jgi:hypothetical protein